MDEAQPVVEVAGGFVDDIAAAEIAEVLNRWFRWILDGAHGEPPAFFEPYDVETAPYAWQLGEDVDWEVGPHARAVGDEVRIAIQTLDTHVPLLGLLRRLGARTTRAVREG